MNPTNTLIENQYHLNGLFEDILNRLKEQGIELNAVSRTHIAGVDEFHVRGAEVSKELVNDFDFKEKHVLDVGCGLGGPCRMLADEFNCTVSGIDMSHEFIRTAQKLSELVNLDGKTEFVQGDALDLPFGNNTFDVVWTQHVQMNIEDKTKFYSEISRVLKDKGSLIYYDIFKKENQDVNYPVPWANDSSVSFLGTVSNMESILKSLGFNKMKVTDQTGKAIEFLNGLFEKLKLHGPPKLGLNVLMGSSTKDKLGNILNGLNENKIELQSGIYIK
ncbi:MAG: methyltransferase domain-containing protein [Cyclobacteriaceae bacterium]|nr:methyltransferase domain-containing protein [Cyclobacteriaceae bacterium]